MIVKRSRVIKFLIIISVLIYAYLKIFANWESKSDSRQDSLVDEVVVEEIVQYRLKKILDSITTIKTTTTTETTTETTTTPTTTTTTEEVKKVEEFKWPKLSDEILEYHRRLNLTNPGQDGFAVILPDKLPLDIELKVNKSWEIYGVNEFVSSLIPLDRDLNDIRVQKCKEIKYSENLPAISVIMVFHNEAFSTMMRSVFALFKRTPAHLLREIILVDDCSEHENLKQNLDDFIKDYEKIKLIRSPVRLGLIKARMFGAVNAKGPVLVFFDAHIEVLHGWLEPLLEPIVRNPNITTLPIIDNIVPESFQFRYYQDPERFQIGGFKWDLIYKWKGVSELEKVRRVENIKPTRSPTMLGAFFVIRKDYFEYLGMYDSDFQVWGAENIELSFKVWMCGGELLQIPCSHAAHMFRTKHPYSKFTVDGFKKQVLRNTDRLAEVWLDEYLRFYHRQTKFENREFGDVTEQKKLRASLGCKSFKWYMENIYYDAEFPDEITDAPTLVDSNINMTSPLQ